MFLALIAVRIAMQKFLLMFHLCVGIAANRLECPKGHSILIFTIFLKNQVKLRNLCRSFAENKENLECMPNF